MLTHGTGSSDLAIIGIASVIIVGAVATGTYFLYIQSAEQPSSASSSSSMSSMSLSSEGMTEQNVTTAHYKVVLTLGPPEKMLTMNQTTTEKSGEVMVSGRMMAMDMNSKNPMFHLEVHIYDIETGSVISDKNVTIQMTDEMGMDQTIPVAVMYGLEVGPSDSHFGNNVSLEPGKYTIAINIAGEVARFQIEIPSASTLMNSSMTMSSTTMSSSSG